MTQFDEERRQERNKKAKGKKFSTDIEQPSLFDAK
jgi:hypothetical protein